MNLANANYININVNSQNNEMKHLQINLIGKIKNNHINLDLLNKNKYHNNHNNNKHIISYVEA